MKKSNVKLLALLLTAAMLLSLLAGCVGEPGETTGSTTDGTTAGTTTGGKNLADYPVSDLEELGKDAKWSEEKTADGWIKVTQDGGETLGYSPNSGVQLLQLDGYAFKDLNKNGMLDLYEDWRQSDEDRAEDLASKLPIESVIGLMNVAATSSFESDGSDATLQNVEKETTQMSVAVANDGFRQVLTRASNMSALAQARWNNNMQAIAEAADPYGIPVQIWTDPRTNFTSGVSNLALAATFDPELAASATAIGNEKYRALGITGLYAPQIDLSTDPRWSRIDGTFGEDPALSRDMTNAVISAMQSTYAEDGTDLGWGENSLIAVMKHWPGDGAGEGGRESHNKTGKYTVYPGDAFETSLIPFVDGGLDLDSLTGMAGGVMTSYSIAFSADESLGELVGSAFSEYKVQLLRSYGFDGVIVTDSSVTSPASTNFTTKDHGVEDLTVAEKEYKAVSAGVDQILASNNYGEQEDILEAYYMFADEMGEEAALARFQESAYRILLNEFRVGIIDNAYVDTTYAVSLIEGEGADEAFALEVAQKSVVMLKNDDNTIKAAATDEKPTVYIPMVYSAAAKTPFGTIPASWGLPVSEKAANRYFNVVTDVIGEPTGEADENGNATYTSSDIIRASEEELVNCNFALVFMDSPEIGSGYDKSTQTYVPVSLQYGPYTASSEGVREESIAGDFIENLTESPYGVITQYVKENRSYYGQSTVAGNYADLQAALGIVANLPENTKVVFCINAINPFVVSEFEPVADAILMGFDVTSEAFLGIITGEVEPSGLLPFQMPANMETVEAQYEDVPRDMECYVDADGNVYDFAFGLNWSGVISDERTETYNVPALTKPSK